MRILITGGGGFIGQKLACKLAARGRLRGQDITAITLIDLSEPAVVDASFAVHGAACDIADEGAVQALFAERGQDHCLYR